MGSGARRRIGENIEGLLRGQPFEPPPEDMKDRCLSTLEPARQRWAAHDEGSADGRAFRAARWSRALAWAAMIVMGVGLLGGLRDTVNFISLEAAEASVALMSAGSASAAATDSDMAGPASGPAPRALARPEAGPSAILFQLVRGLLWPVLVLAPVWLSLMGAAWRLKGRQATQRIGKAVPVFSRCGTALRRLVRKTWKAVIIAILALNALPGIAIRLDQKYLPKPLVSTPEWNKDKYKSSKNPYRHYEAAVRLIPDDASKVLQAQLWYWTASEERSRYGTPEPPKRADLVRAMAAIEPAIRELKNGASCSVEDFESRRILLNSEEMFSEFSELRSLARLVSVDAREKAERGEAREAVEELLSVLEMGNDLFRSPTLISCLVAMAVKAIAAKALVATLWEPGLTPQDYKRVAMALERLEQEKPPLLKVMEGEYVTCRASLQAAPSPCLGLILRQYDRAYARAFNVYSRPYPDIAGLEAQRPSKTLGALGGQILSIVRPVFKKYAFDGALTRGMATMAALEAFRLEHGRYPDALQELVPGYISKVPIDPFTINEPFRYSRKGDKYLLYSVGPDLADDRGTFARIRDLWQKEKPKERADLVFAPGLDLWARPASEPVPVPPLPLPAR